MSEESTSRAYKTDTWNRGTQPYTIHHETIECPGSESSKFVISKQRVNETSRYYLIIPSAESRINGSLDPVSVK